MSSLRTDATQAGHFLSRQLEQVLPKLYEKKYPKLWANEGLYFPASPNLEMGAEEIVEETQNTVGEAQIMSDQADDLPLVDTTIDESKFKTFAIVAGVRFSITSLRAAAKANRPIRETRLKSMNRAMAERVHKLSVYGSARHSARGFFNDGNVPLDTTHGYDPTDGALTFDDHVAYIADSLTKVEGDTNLIEGIETILVPPKIHNVWAKSTKSGTGITVIRHMLENFGPSSGGTLRQIIKVNEGRSDLMEQFGAHAAATNKDRIVYTPTDPEAVERLFYSTDYLPEQLRGVNYELYGICGTSEAIYHYPGSVLFSDVPKVV